MDFLRSFRSENSCTSLHMLVCKFMSKSKNCANVSSIYFIIIGLSKKEKTSVFNENSFQQDDSSSIVPCQVFSRRRFATCLHGNSMIFQHSKHAITQATFTARSISATMCMSCESIDFNKSLTIQWYYTFWYLIRSKRPFELRIVQGLNQFPPLKIM